VPEPLPPKQKTVRRIVHRNFTKTQASGSLSSPGDDVGKDISGALIDLTLGNIDPESSLGPFETRSARKIADVPANHRVNKVVIDDTLSFDVTISGQVTVNDTNMDYTWGPPEPSVTVLQRNHKVIFKEKKPDQITTQTIARDKAEKTPFVVPPDP
jgi:hypothetical protein